MKRLLTAAIVSILLVCVISGTSPALAQDEENATRASSFTESVSANQTTAGAYSVNVDQTTAQTYSVNDRLMDELDRLVKMLREAENNGDRELIAALQEKIQIIKDEIAKASEVPTTTAVNSVSPVAISSTGEQEEDKPTVTATSGVNIVSSARLDSCEELRTLEAKKKHYEDLYSLSDDELTDKGYTRGREEIRKTIASLEEMIQRLRIECEAGVTNRVGSDNDGQTWTSATGTRPLNITARPIAVESGMEITDYYKRRIAEIATEEIDIDRKVTVLKELRDEIDRLIEELIKSKDAISTQEVSGLVTKIQVRPGEVKMDEVAVKTVDKSVVARINDKDLEIKPARAQVIMNDGDLEIKAPELSIENDVLRVGNSEVKLVPSTVLEKINVEAKEMELIEENSRAVYKIKTGEKRKLLGFIPLEVKNTLTVDATNTDSEIIKEERPWWAFFTTR